MTNESHDRIYLDYCATTPVHPAVVSAMLPALEETFGNPSSLHSEGREAADLLANARARAAQHLGLQPEEIIFTSGATEADNLALHGLLHAQKPTAHHLITSSIEHHAVLHAAETLREQGFELTLLPVDGHGQVNPQDLMDAIRPDTGLISIMAVNNEIGTLQPIDDLAAIAHEHGILFHTDAVQAVGTCDLALDALHVDSISLSAHKIYGPKGIGLLGLRSGADIKPLLLGGPQEAARRAGTENVPGAVGFAEALKLACEGRSTNVHHLASLRTRMMEGITHLMPDTHINGHPGQYAAHVLSVTFPGVEAEMMLDLLDQRGIAASMGSACNAESITPSHVLLAIGLDLPAIAGTIRFSFGLPTTDADIDRVLELLPDLVERARIA